MQTVKKESARVRTHPDAQKTVKQWLLDAFSLPQGCGAVKGLCRRAGAVLAVVVAAAALEPLFFAAKKLLPLLIITLCAMAFAVLAALSKDGDAGQARQRPTAARCAPGGVPYGRENHQ